MASGNWFKRRREELGLSQRRIAAQLDITDTTIGSWERGDTLPNLSMINKLAAVYKVSIARVAAEVATLAEPTAAKV